ERHVRPLAARPFHQQVPRLRSAAAPGRPTVAFFVGCLVDKFFPEVGQAVLQVLHYHGVGLVIPAQQACCGIPALSAGDLTAFSRLVRHHLRHWQTPPWDYLVTACATCTATIKKLWPLFLPEVTAGEKNTLAQLAAKTMDISQFLVEIVGVAGLPKPAAAPALTVTYHDPCHLKKSLGLAAPPRTLLRAAPGVQLLEMAGADQCCGCGGSFNLQQYEIAKAIGRRKIDNILATKAQVVATGCPACMLQFVDLLSQTGARVQVRHTIEVYAQTLAAPPG
ncbi:MAG: (Fe-S)-binding protein, partial [Desulfobacca sp.]|uniref:(Fe-S)-binding protein n=1 Tax=Desulfobacca sp. TaxID=2067990 RepID=UPI00404B4FFD